ncbi:MAG TPA: glycosyltransferase family 39 protein [Planctomycetia bacterium]|nr:glycosyltransferase family 39 protein [Planctomycetia bacterium]
MRKWIGTAAIFLLAAAWFLFADGGVQAEPVFVDEGATLAQTSYARLVAARDFNHPDWLHFSAYDHQPLYKYYLGAALAVSGHADAIPPDPGKWEAWMQSTYKPPKDDALLAARRAISLAAAIGVAGIYALGCAARGPMTGLIAAVLFAGSPVVTTHARRAMIDAVAPGLGAIALGCALAGLATTGRARWWRLAAAGIFGALAATAKISAAAPLVAACGGCLLAAVFVRGRLQVAALGAFLLLGSVGAGTFLGIDPYYWAKSDPREASYQGNVVRWQSRTYSMPAATEIKRLAAAGPIDRLQHALTYRRAALADAPLKFPDDAIPTARRIEALAFSGIGRWACGARGYTEAEARRPWTDRIDGIDRARGAAIFGLALLGVIFAYTEGRRQSRTGAIPSLWILALWPLVEMAILLPNLTLDWDRYYLGAIAWSSVLAAFAVTGIGERIVNQLRLPPRPAEPPALGAGS